MSANALPDNHIYLVDSTNTLPETEVRVLLWFTSKDPTVRTEPQNFND